MPEGDTIFRAARTLHRALAGKVVTRFESVLQALLRVDEDHPIAGRTVEAVEAAGKHLLVRFSGDLVLRTHMRMNGSWHIYRPGEKWQRRRSDMRVVIATEDFEAVAFSVPVAEFHSSASLARQTDMRTMGPDLLRGQFDDAEAIRRMRARGGHEIGPVVLNQRVMAGAGNVFKSEILFLCGVNPFARVGQLTDEQLAAIVTRARTLLGSNVVEGTPAGIVTYCPLRQTTRRSDPGERLWVYGRRGEPCRKCGTPILYRKQGADVRSTYWCPLCQPTRIAARESD